MELIRSTNFENKIIFTGSDYAATFSGKGKVMPIKKLESVEELQIAFASHASSEVVEESLIKIRQKFVCQMYMEPKLNSVDEARLELFTDKLSFSSVKDMDSSSWPPCLLQL